MKFNLIFKITVIFFLTLIGCAKINFTPTTQEIHTSTLPNQTSSSNTPSAPNAANMMSFSQTVDYANKQVDFLIVFDDSNSMLPDLKKLAASLGTFLRELEASNLDWQMCMTTTGSNSVNGIEKWGESFTWIGAASDFGSPTTLLKKGMSNLDGIFVNTVNSLKIGGPNSGDERGLKATNQHFQKGRLNMTGSNGCYRKDAAISVIIVSNEDERSVGGDKSKLKSNDAINSYRALEAEDFPENLLISAKSMFGDNLRFTFNSIIVKPGDSNCELLEDKSGTSPSHPGMLYARMSTLTNGGIGSICDSNFTNNLNIFKDKIVNSLSNLDLPCEPIAGKTKVLINQKDSTDFDLTMKTVKFRHPLQEGTKIDIQFECRLSPN